ncbi:hypothetical protein SAY86_000100 [Trapa natans]|uniref:Homeobox domain-containing protein n=1 Tax=Trapa natans TaxID=22666 RepID=A0AAN7MBH6_TRANT|nr:hypothetical protein SAY86_000100 [Trapa natans]
MAGKEDLGLSLSLSFHQSTSHHHHQSSPLQLNLMPSLLPSDTSSPSGFASLDRSYGEARSFLRGIDVNRLPSGSDCEEEAVVSSPNSTLSSLSGKRSERETNPDDLIADNERDSSRGISDEEDGDGSRKKLRLSKDQSAILEESFKEHNTLNTRQKLALAKQLGLRPRQVEVWFQNRRARTKLKQTEVDCEFLKRCCGNLTVENRRLQKEVQELRALKLSPQFYMQLTPPTTLTMCPSCERVAVPAGAPELRKTIAIAPAHAMPIPISPWGPPARHASFDILLPRS